MWLNLEIVFLFVLVSSMGGNIISLMKALSSREFADSFAGELDLDFKRVRIEFSKIPAWRLAINGWGSLLIFAQGVYAFGSPVIAWGVISSLWILSWLCKISQK